MNQYEDFFSNDVLESIVVGESEWDKIVANYKNTMLLDAAPQRNEKRHESRYQCKQMIAGLKFNESQSLNNLVLAKCNDISSGGLGLVHNRLILIGTWCEMLLLNRFGDTVTKTGIVKNCNNLPKGKFKIGIQFNDIMNPFEFVNMPGN